MVKPLEVLDPDLRITYVLSETRTPIRSERTGEEGTSETVEASEIRAHVVRTIDQAEVDERQSQFLAEVLRRANPPEERDREIVTNMVRFLSILDSAYEEVDQLADYVFFTRPDLRWLEPLSVGGLVRPIWPWVEPLMGCATANWGGGAAPNDRFALLSSGAVKDYMTRISLLPMFLDSEHRFGAERFLAFAMQRHNIYPVIRARAERIRIGGVPARERFKKTRFSQGPRDLRRGSRRD